MTENEVKDLTVKKLNKEGWYCWIPMKVIFQQSDICGVFDLIALKGHRIKLIQYTTKTNLAHRRNKIRRFFAENNINIKFGYIYAYDERYKKFVIEKVRSDWSYK